MAVNLPKESYAPASAPHNTPLAIIAAVAAVGAIWYAQDLLIPLCFAVLLSYALRPIHRRLVRWRMPAGLAAALVLAGVLLVTGAGALMLRGQVTIVLNQLPAVTQRLREAIQTGRGAFSSTVEPVQQAASELNRAANDSAPPPARGVTRVQVEQPPMRATDLLWRGTVSALGLLTQFTIVLFLVFYLLASGDRYKGRLLKLAGPSFPRRQLTIEILNDVTSQIERFVIARLGISAIVAAATGVTMWMLGLAQPAVWGIAAGILNNIPYVGPSAAVVGIALAALVQFGTLTMASIVGGAAGGIAVVEGFVITPWIMGRAGRMNTGVVFVSLMFWGWVWGVWGLLFGVPIMMCVKAFCDHVPEFRVVSELLRD